MEYKVENELHNFPWWSGAASNADLLTYDELDSLEGLFEDLFVDTPTETDINDVMWFEFEMICEYLGIEYNSSTGKIIREED